MKKKDVSEIEIDILMRLEANECDEEIATEVLWELQDFKQSEVADISRDLKRRIDFLTKGI